MTPLIFMIIRQSTPCFLSGCTHDKAHLVLQQAATADALLLHLLKEYALLPVLRNYHSLLHAFLLPTHAHKEVECKLCNLAKCLDDTLASGTFDFDNVKLLFSFYFF